MRSRSAAFIVIYSRRGVIHLFNEHRTQVLVQFDAYVSCRIFIAGILFSVVSMFNYLLFAEGSRLFAARIRVGFADSIRIGRIRIRVRARDSDGIRIRGKSDSCDH